MKWVLLLALAVCTSADLECVAWECNPKGDVWPDNVCAMQRQTNVTQWDLKTGACKGDAFCPAEIGPLMAYTSVSCLELPHPQPAAIAYPGERCDMLRTCLVPEGTFVYCFEGVCTTVSPCVNVQDCGLGMTCSKGECVELSPPGAACTLDTDCVLNSRCDIGPGAPEGSGKCVLYSSVLAGQGVQSCVISPPSTLASHSLCASGYCYETSTTGEFACTGPITSSGPVPMRCETDTSTCTSARESVSGQVLTQNCQCGYDGYAYCPLFPGDSEYQAYLDDLQNFIRSPHLSNCNTARHQTESFYSGDYFWCGQNLTKIESYHYLRAYLYPEVVMAQECVLKILAPAYYQLMPKHEDLETYLQETEEAAHLLLLSGIGLALFY